METVAKGTDDPLLRDHMTKVQLRLIQQKLAEERDRASRASSRASYTSRGSPPEDKVQHALRRQRELLKVLKQEDARRPRSHEHKKLTPLPPPSPSRRSLPVGGQLSKTPSQAPSDMTSQRHVIEHKFTHQLPPAPSPQTHAPPPAPAPLAYQPQYQPVAAPPPPQPQVMHQPQPVVLASPDSSSKGNYKQEVMEMMMMQNAQVHQIIMQQMMMGAIPKQPPPPPPPPPPPVPIDHAALNKVADILTLERTVPKNDSVHHHHYSPPNMPPPPHPPYHLPPLPHPHYPPYGRYPMEVEPLKLPRARSRQDYVSPLPTHRSRAPPRPKKILQYPGPEPLRRFRHAAYAVWFTKVLRRFRRSKKRWRVNNQETDLIFSIKLKEAVTALHNIYRNVSGQIFPLIAFLLQDTTRDLTIIMSTKSNDERKKAAEEVASVLQNLTDQISTIIPPDGALGTHRKSHVTSMCREGKLFPGTYLLQIEKDQLQFDGAGRSTNIQDKEMYILLVALFYTQSLIRTLLLKSYDYQVIDQPPSTRAQRNVKLMATIYMYLVRQAMVPKGYTPLPRPNELANQLFTDEEMATAYKLIKKSLAHCDDKIRKWGREYVDRLKLVR